MRTRNGPDPAVAGQLKKELPAFAVNGPQTRYPDARVGALRLEAAAGGAAQLGVAGTYCGDVSALARVPTTCFELLEASRSPPHPATAASSVQATMRPSVELSRVREDGEDGHALCMSMLPGAADAVAREPWGSRHWSPGRAGISHLPAFGTP
jgi:hypothetical protein